MLPPGAPTLVLHTINLDDRATVPMNWPSSTSAPPTSWGTPPHRADLAQVRAASALAAQRPELAAHCAHAHRGPPRDIRLALNAKSCRVIEAFMRALDSDGCWRPQQSYPAVCPGGRSQLRPARLSEYLESGTAQPVFAGDGSGLTRGWRRRAPADRAAREIARRATG